MPPPIKHSEQERQQMILEALDPDKSITEVAERYNISRSRLYVLIQKATRNPEQQLDAARREAEFRRQIMSKMHGEGSVKKIHH